MMRNRLWMIHLLLGVSVVTAWFLLGAGSAQQALYLAVAVATPVAVIAALAIHRPRYVAPWIVLGTALTFMSSGDVVFAFFIDPEAFPSWADALYLTGALLLTVSLAMVARARTPGRDLAGVIDATIVATSAGLLAWVFVLAPTSQDSELTWLGQFVSQAYPVYDVLLLSMLVRLSLGGMRGAPARLLITAFCLWLVADVSMYGMLTILENGTLDQDSIRNVPWLLGYVCLGAAALHPRMGAVTEHTAAVAVKGGWRRIALLTAASLIAPGLLLFQAAFGGGEINSAAIGAASVALFLLVMVRMAGLIREVERNAREFQKLAQIDGLTGVPNRRSWDSDLLFALEQARTDSRPLTVALVDIDHFKRYNDEYGHQRGDELLQLAGIAWKSSLRRGDSLYRYGGEEFAVLLPDCAVEQAVPVLDRLRGATPMSQTVSAGVACWDGSETAATLVARADRALYAAKRSGRDRVGVEETGARPAEAVAESVARADH